MLLQMMAKRLMARWATSIVQLQRFRIDSARQAGKSLISALTHHCNYDVYANGPAILYGDAESIPIPGVPVPHLERCYNFLKKHFSITPIQRISASSTARRIPCHTVLFMSSPIMTTIHCLSSIWQSIMTRKRRQIC